jgi:hypothetical protein
MNTHRPPDSPTPALTTAMETTPMRTARTAAIRAGWILLDGLQQLTENRAQQLLLDSADRLERFGWRQGEYWPNACIASPYVEGDPCCALGALAVGFGVDTYDCANWAFTARPVLALALDTLATEINADCADGEHAPDVAAWNDDPERTATEVIAAMHHAAGRLGQPPDPGAVLATFSALFDGAQPGAGTDVVALPGAPSAKNAHQAGPTTSPNHQRSTSQENLHV